MEILAFINQKGGVAKTTTTLAVGSDLRRRGKRVLFIDLDPQGSLSELTRANTTAERTIYEVLTGRLEAQHTIQATPQGHIIAASDILALEGILGDTGKEYKLREALEPLEGHYDYILIDCPPALGTLTINALTAATGCIIPAMADCLSQKGLDKLHKTIAAVKKYTNRNLSVLGIVLTKHSDRTIISREFTEAVECQAADMGTKLFTTRIREGVAIREAQALGEDLFTYAPKSNAAADYSALVDEIMEG